MGNKMLIDATHPEETRVVVLRGNRVEEFDYESAAKKQLRGNIYLAKVTRVEPSLQAAFVNYGGNRHGFLAFNEIHPDYYQLPMAERQALKAEEARARRQAFADDGDGVDANGYGEEASVSADPAVKAEAQAAADAVDEEDNGDEASPEEATIALEAALPAAKYSADLYADTATAEQETMEAAPLETAAEATDAGEDDAASEADASDDAPNGHENGHGDEPQERPVEMVGSEDALEELPERTRRRRRIYKIQEVIKRGQIILVQVVKEERGNKGAALTTYLSLAGRYTVLMPNTGSGGGISRKISSPGDRKRLREIAGELDVPEGMGLIIRTAGAARTKTEIKRDYEYLLRLWENVRDLTLKSSAPALVYEEGDLIKRSIRDLYNREIDEVLVAGDDAYRDAKDFMRMLMPSHAKNVQPYKDPEPLFTRYEVERQLNAMFSPQVTLPSGGYIVLNQTEALVAIDVNSGKATREFSIEDTALKTNLEASEEIARQLRLRDLAGLIVVDFIDMEEKRNNRAVERRLKECLRNDRARIQVGHISHFGLLEMSRQRLRTGMVEGSTTQCPHCQGTGVIRSTESVALSVLRSLEDWLRTNAAANLNAIASVDVALYILNQKRGYLNDIETRYGVTLTITASERMHGSNFYIEKVAPPTVAITHSHAVTQSDRIIQPFEDEGVESVEEDSSQKSRRKRRRRRGRGDRMDSRDHMRVEDESREQYDDSRAAVRTVAEGAEGDEDGYEDGALAAEGDAQPQQHGEDRNGEGDGQSRRRSRRRGRRGGRQRGLRSREAGELTAPQHGEEGEAQTDGSGTPVSPVQADAGGEAMADRGEAERAAMLSDGGEQAPTTQAGGEQAASVPPAERSEQPVAPEPVAAKPEPQAEARVVKPEPVETASGGEDFRPSPEQQDAPRTKTNGSGARHNEPAFAMVAQGSDGDAQPVAASVQAVAVADKPRGTRRGWWQRRDG